MSVKEKKNVFKIEYSEILISVSTITLLRL